MRPHNSRFSPQDVMHEITEPSRFALRAGWSGLGDAVSRRLWFLKGESLCAAARRRTGLVDFGDPPLEPALSTLADSLEQEADLHPLGRFLIRTHLQDLLATRLRLAAQWSSVHDCPPIERPLFITGMPRSGSTFLHELLAEDPGNRAPRVWEVMFPCPAPNPGGSHDDPRIRRAAAGLWWFRRLAPEADAVFPMRARTPHECVAIHSYTMLSDEFLSTCRIPSYERLLRSADLRPVYAWQKRFLQHLQQPSPRRRWVLKSPDHVYGLEALFALFPDARIIQTHRNPLEVIESSSRLTEVLWGLYARSGNREEIGLREARVLSESMDRFLLFRDRHPELQERFIDVKYSELVADPLSVVRRIYQRLETPLPELAAQRMSSLVAKRSRYRRRRRRPALAELGVEPRVEAHRFQHYCSRFDIALREAEPG